MLKDGQTLAGSCVMREREFPVCGQSLGCVYLMVRKHKGGKRIESQGVQGILTLSAFQEFSGRSVF